MVHTLAIVHYILLLTVPLSALNTLTRDKMQYDI